MSAEPPYIAFYYAATKGKEISIQWDPGDDWFRKSDEGWIIYQLTARNGALIASVGAHTKADENVLMERQVIMVDGQEVVVFHTVKNPPLP